MFHALGNEIITTKIFPSMQFKLNLQELESARQPLDRWRVERGVGLPLVLEVK